MEYCHVEFVPKDDVSLLRTTRLFEMIKSAKDADEMTNVTPFVNFLTETERSCFWNPSPEEMEEWNKEWFSTPIEIRHSQKMITPRWDFAQIHHQKNRKTSLALDNQVR